MDYQASYGRMIVKNIVKAENALNEKIKHIHAQLEK